MSDLEAEVERLKNLLKEKNDIIERLNSQLKRQCDGVNPQEINVPESSDEASQHAKRQRLDNASIARYSRQLILPELGVGGQLRLCNASVLIVGCGGLGCPAASYLVAAGVGRLGLVDYDEVELSNLHRQILHTERRIGLDKAASVAFACKQLNSSVQCVPYKISLDSSNASDIIRQYDVVLDCTDNVATRYLLNDACVLLGKPLVSGSALRFEGQLTVYHHEGGPCYRCLFPKPPPADTVTNCSDGGVLGVVPGVIGCLQALEAIKILAQVGMTYRQRLLLFDALDGSFRVVRLRGKQESCIVCGSRPTLRKLIDYEQFCGAKATDKGKSLMLLKADERISVQEYRDMVDRRQEHVLVDVRPPGEMEICQLENSLNIPLDKLEDEQSLTELRQRMSGNDSAFLPKPVFLLCRQGNDSQTAVRKLQEKFPDNKGLIKDIRGGLAAWAKHVDTSFPVY